jgi:DNA mismatch repair protein MutS2
VQILELHGNEAVVTAGSLRMRVPVAELAPARGDRRKATFPTADRQQASLQRAGASAPQPLALGSATCDVRGLRADEAVRSVEQFLDRVFQEGAETGLIIHGHGTGALKQTVRDYLKDSAYVGSHRAGDSHEGGDGVTVFTLKGG